MWSLLVKEGSSDLPKSTTPDTVVANVSDTIDDHPVNIARRVTNALNAIGYAVLTTAVVELFTRL